MFVGAARFFVKLGFAVTGVATGGKPRFRGLFSIGDVDNGRNNKSKTEGF